MIDPTKLLRSAFLALALLFLAPLGVGGTILGVEAAQAATVSKISVVGNSEVDDGTVIKYLALKVGDVATPGRLSASVDALQATGLFKSVNVTMVTVDKAKFRNPARPGDVLEYHIKKIKRRRAMGWYEAKAMLRASAVSCSAAVVSTSIGRTA